MNELINFANIFFLYYLLIYATLLTLSSFYSSVKLYKEDRLKRLQNKVNNKDYFPMSITVPAYNEELTIIDTINNILMLKSSDEMFSTLDLGIIDLKKGILSTIKMGACSTYIKRSTGEIELISTASLPVGILSDVNIERDSRKVKEGDYIIMVSDGIIDAGKNKNLGDNWVIYFLKNLKTTNPKEISKEILNKALDIQENNVEDDMTVLVTKMCKS